MGKLEAQNFDMQIAQITNAYLLASSRGEWELAAHYLEIKNNTIREKNRVSNLKPYLPKDNSLKSELVTQLGFKQWCMRIAKLIEAAVTRERDLLAGGYGR